MVVNLALCGTREDACQQCQRIPFKTPKSLARDSAPQRLGQIISGHGSCRFRRKTFWRSGNLNPASILSFPLSRLIGHSHPAIVAFWKAVRRSLRKRNPRQWDKHWTRDIRFQSVTGLPDVWQLQVFFADDSNEQPDEDLKAILSAFWDAQKPEYVTANGLTNWPNIWLMQSAGFRQVGVLPLSDGPVVTWGWRKCH